MLMTNGAASGHQLTRKGIKLCGKKGERIRTLPYMFAPEAVRGSPLHEAQCFSVSHGGKRSGRSCCRG